MFGFKRATKPTRKTTRQRAASWKPRLELLEDRTLLSGIIANFTDGNDVTNGGARAPTPDSLSGTAGDGWGGAWLTGNTRGSLAASVISTIPLNSGGNYLSATVTNTVTSGPFADGQADIYREYTSTGGLQTTGPHTIQFDFRIDESPASFASNFTNIFDDYVFGGASNGSLLGLGTGGSFDTWRIEVIGTTAFGLPAHHFGFENGNRDGNTTSPVDSGLVAAPGITYHFTINVDPASRSWTGTIFDGTNTVTAGSLGFRSTEFNSGFIFFNGRANVTSETRTFAVDSILITSVLPDIAMQSAQLQPGNTVQFTYQTTGNPGPFQVGLYRSSDGKTFNSADQIGSLQTVTPSPTNPQTPGTFILPNGFQADPAKPYLLVAADPNNTIAESNEDNNVASFFFSPLGVDIAMISAQLGAENTVQFTYQTTGNPGPFQVGLYRSVDGTTFDSADLIGSLQTITGNPTSPQIGSLPLPANFPADPAKPYLLVAADPNNAIEESNENNNTASFFFSHFPPPVVLGVSPNAGPAPGTVVQVLGTGFQPGSQVFFNDVPATIIGSSTATSLPVIVPALQVGFADVKVVNPDGQQSVLSGAFFALPANPQAGPRPRIGSVSPSAGPASGGEVVKIFGSGFQGGTKVFFGGVPALLSAAPTANVLTVVVPALPVGPAAVKVVNPDGQQAVLAGAFLALRAAPPVLAGLSFNFGPPGAVLQISGTGFLPGSQVFIGGVLAAPGGAPTPTTLTVVVPALRVGSADVVVVNPDGEEAVLPGAFFVLPGIFVGLPPS